MCFSRRIRARNVLPGADVLRVVANDTGGAACTAPGTEAEADAGPGLGGRRWRADWRSSAALFSWRNEGAQQVLMAGGGRQEGESWEGCGVAWLLNSEHQPALATTRVNAKPFLLKRQENLEKGLQRRMRKKSLDDKVREFVSVSIVRSS